MDEKKKNELGELQKENNEIKEMLYGLDMSIKTIEKVCKTLMDRKQKLSESIEYMVG